MTRYLKNMEKEIIIENQLDEIPRINQFIEELGMSLKLPSGITMSVNLAIEEAITNIIRHAYPEGNSSEIILRASAAPGVLTFLITDEGISFDPTNRKVDNETPLTLEQHLTQGLGLFLIRRTMDEVEYHSTGGQNQLILRKLVDASFKPESTLKTNVCKIEGITILAIEGRLDTTNANEFNTIIQPLLTNAHPNVIINCEGMSYISSSGLRSFIILQKSVTQHHGNMIIEAVRPEIQKIFDMTGCSALFTIR